MPRTRKPDLTQSELENGEVATASNVAVVAPSLKTSLDNGMIADESQSGKVQDTLNLESAQEAPKSHTVIEVPNSPSFGVGRRRRTGVVSMTPQPMQQLVAENAGNPLCPSCKAPLRICSCKNHPDTLNFSGKIPIFTMAGPLNGNQTGPDVDVITNTSSSGGGGNECSLVGRGPIMSSLPWQAMRREDVNTPQVPITPDDTVRPMTESIGTSIPVPNSVTSLTMLSSVYGVKPSNVETVLSGLVLDKPPSSILMTTDREQNGKNTDLLSVESEVPRTRCHSLPSSSFSISKVTSNTPCLVPRGNDNATSSLNLTTSVPVSHSSSVQTLSGYSISRTSKLTRPEVIEQHISKIISENAAIVETQDPLWVKRYMRQSSSLAADDDAKKAGGKFRRFSEEVTVKYKSPPSPKFKSKLHSALLGKVDEVPYPYETSSPNVRKMSLDSRVRPVRKAERYPQMFLRVNEKGSHQNLSKSTENLGILLDGEKHPENPEGSIIKDLLLKSRDSALLRKSPIPLSSDEDSRGLLNGLNGTRHDAIYNCLECNIGFRSKENLEAHKAHYCKGKPSSSVSPNFLEVPSSAAGPAVNKRSSSFSYPRGLTSYSGTGSNLVFGSGQILKKQLLSGGGTSSDRSLSPSKKRKTSEPVFSFTPSDIIFGYPGVLKHGRNSTVTSSAVETGFPSSTSNPPLTLLNTVPQQTTTSVSVVVTISKPVLNSGGTLVHTQSRPSTTSMTQNLNVPGSVIVSPQGMESIPTVTTRNSSESTLSLSATSSQSSTRPLCLNQSINSPSESSDKLKTDAKTSDNLISTKDDKLVNSTIAQKTEKMIVPTVVLSPCSPIPEDTAVTTSEEKSPKKFLFAKTQQVASRPTSLPLSKKAVTLIGSTIISPETPRPKRKCLQQFINGQAYTTLRLKCSTRSFYCCIYRLQPMYVCQKNQPKLSMYSNWQIYPHKESMFGLTPGQEISLYDTKKGQRSGNTYSTSIVSNTLVVTHSSYWQFRKHEVDAKPNENSKHNGKQSDIQTDPASDRETGERVVSTKTSGGQVGMESEPTEEGKSVGSECLLGIVQEKKKSFDNSIVNGDLNKVDDETGSSISRKFSQESGEIVINSSNQISGDNTSTNQATTKSTVNSKSPKRVRIFQGGFRSNEDYTYIRGRGRGKYVCEECGIRCKKPSMLKKHIRTHTDLRPYKCSHCAFAFKTKGNLTKHMKSKAHHKKCLELGIVPVPTTIDDSQIDESALSKQFSDADDEDDDDDLDEDEDESDYDEEDDDSQDHRDDEEMCSEKDLDGVTVECEQFEDAEPIVPPSSTSASGCGEPEVAKNTGGLSTELLSLENDTVWDPEREAARSLLNLSSCGINRINNSTADWVMSSPVSQIHKSEGSIGSMESLSSATGCVLSGSEIAEEAGSESYGSGIPRVHWTSVPELSPKSRRRSYSVNMPLARSAGNDQLSEHTVSREQHLQTRVISFASSLPVVMEDQLETTTARRYSMSAIGEARNMGHPSTSGVFDSLQNEESGRIKRTDSSLGLPKSWLTINGEQPIDLRITKEPRDMVHLPLSLTPHLWKSSVTAAAAAVETSSVTCGLNLNDKGVSYDVLTSPTSDLLMSPDRNNCGMSDYIYSTGMTSSRLSSGSNYFATGASDGEEMMPSKMPYELTEHLEADGSVDMLEASYSPEADDYQHPLSPVSQNSMDNDSQCNHIDDMCGGTGNSGGMVDSYGVKERLQPCNVSDRRSGGANSSQIEFRLSATVPSGSSISTSNHVRIESEGKCSCSICNKTFSKPSQLRLHVNIHYFERPFRCESCAVSFRTKGHLQKHKRSVSHYNKVNMNMTFGTPTTDNPRPFKCGDCKIAFRIHGHLAKHLRSKMHIMKLECLGKLPFGMYAEMERSGVNLNEIDTTDCENSLESLQLMAHRLYQQDPRRMRWHTADGQAPPQTVTQPHLNNVHQVVKESEVVREAQTVKMPAPVVQYSLSPIPIEESLQTAPMRRSSIITSPIQSSSSLSGAPQSHYSRPQPPSNKLISQGPQSTMTSATTNHLGHVKREPEENNCDRKSPSRSVVNVTNPSIGHFINDTVQPVIEEYTQPKVNVTVESNVPTFLHRSCTCHLCSRVFKSAKFLQVHLYCDHKQQQQQGQTGQQQSTVAQWPSTAVSTTSGGGTSPKPVKDVPQQWLDCDRTITNGIMADSFSCDICRKQFPTQISLQQHLLTHAQLRPFVCDTCDAGFTSSVMLDTHLATHQQDKSFMCNECGKSFAILVDFQRHVQAHLNDAS